MDLRDFIVTPLVLIAVFVAAWSIRPYVTDHVTRKYFLPGLTVRIVGALALGLIYQFYYEGGDTYNYHTHGSRVIWEAFSDSMENGFKLFFTNDNQGSIFKYTSRIYFYRDPSSFFVIRLATLFDLLTFSTYSATAVLFSVVGFVGSWMFFLTFYKQFPDHHRGLAIASLFIPSVIFWGSGVLKDTISLSCLGIATYQIYKIFIEKRIVVSSVLLLIVSLAIIFVVKKFILQAFLPAAILWIAAVRFYEIRSVMLRILLVPSLLIIITLSGYFAMKKIGEGDKRFELSQIARTARITAYDIRYWSGKDAGSGYVLGELDDSFGGLLKLAPAAINVSLFRPYLWEVKNPLMLFSALESLALLCFCLYLVLTRFRNIIAGISDGNVLFCLCFSIIFAFAVGVSTFNFGTLARYKIPILPYFFTSLVILRTYSKRDKNVAVLEEIE